MNLRPFARAGLALAASLLIAACGSKISAENFERIQDGMSQKEVVAILGEPTETSAINIAGVSGGMATWQEGNTVISVQFLNDKVKGKQLNREAARPQAK